MSGSTPQLSQLKSRKQLLIAESELNREELSAEWQALAHGARGFADRTKTMVVWVSSAALLVAVVTALRHAPTRPRGARSSWLQRIMKGARAASSVWLALRPPDDKDDSQFIGEVISR